MTQALSNSEGDQLAHTCPSVPRSIMTADRDELDDILHINGTLPDDLQGHVFIVAPVGTINSGGLPFTNGGSFLNGDGMVYRLDFDEAEKVKLKTRIVQPPDYLADELTQPGTPFATLGFRNHGILRFSFYLGARNELNTAFLPMKFPGEALERLLVTYDAGRPYEMDTESLELITPVGSQQEWRAALKEPTFLFQPIFSTAHPAFDGFTGEMFAVNYGRSVGNFIDNIPFIQDLDQLFPKLRSFWEKLTLWGDIEDFVYLIRWDGTGPLERWKLVLPDGSPIRIQQTIHQIGISQDYIVLMDTSFATGIEQLLNNPFPGEKKIEEYLRKALESSPIPDSYLYVVRRADLENGQIPAQGQSDVEVQVRRVMIPMEAAHFLMDYANPDDQITLHISHICAWDVAEWIRSYDKSAYPPHSPVPDHLPGMEVSEMDISRLGRYVIDGKGNGETPVEAKITWDSTCTWGTGLYAYRDRLSSGLPPEQLEDIFWISFGLWDDLVTQFLGGLYKHYKHQQIPQTEVVNLAKTGKPACLFRIHTVTMEIADCYSFPRGYIVSSPQFIPRRGGDDSSTDGYIICTVFFQDVNEFWIFEAWNLQQGPKCKLSHASLKFAFTLHTAWLPAIGSRQASYRILAQQDFQPQLETLPYPPEIEEEDKPAIAEFLRNEWFPHLARFASQTSEISQT
jgi:carotenoid cleavage dioxygenase-like enzyme